MEDTPGALAIYVGGLSLVVAGLLLAGWLGIAWMRTGLGTSAPAAGVWGLVLVVITTAGGLAMWRYETVARGPASVAVGALSALFRLDWLYRLVWSGIHLLESLVFNLAAVLEGEGAVLWVLAAIVLLWLALK